MNTWFCIETNQHLLPCNNACWGINRFRSLRHMRKTGQHALVFLQIKNTFRSLISSPWEFDLISIDHYKVICPEDTCFPLIRNQGSFDNLAAIRNAGVQVLCPYCIHTFQKSMMFRQGTSSAWIAEVLYYSMQCPLLCKEFIVDAWQLYYARSKGADAVLLIAAVLPDLDIKYMLKICKILGMAALVEVEFFLWYILHVVSTATTCCSQVIWFSDSTGLCYWRFMMKGKWTVF